MGPGRCEAPRSVELCRVGKVKDKSTTIGRMRMREGVMVGNVRGGRGPNVVYSYLHTYD